MIEIEQLVKSNGKMEKEGIQLPTKVKEGVTINPKSMIIYGLAKSGKTTSLSKLDNCLIIDTEKGTDFVEGTFVMQLPENLGAVGKFKWLKDLAIKIKNEGYPYKYVCIDTLSELDTLAEHVGTFVYCNSIQGKKFNRDAQGVIMKPDNPEYESVLTLPNGFGYRYSREAILDIFESLKSLGSVCTIFVCHVADKMMTKTGNTEVMVKDLALVGKTRDILPRMVDAVANLYNEEGKTMISFVGSEHKIGGVRAKHLLGFNGELDWSKIFIK